MQKRKNPWFIHIRQMLCLGIVSVALGVLLLTVVYCMPVNSVRRNVFASAEKFFVQPDREDARGRLQKYLSQNRELYTDAIMVQNACEKIPGKNPFEHAMWVYHLDLDENVWTPEATLEYLSGGGDTAGMFLHQYSRYWHGYLVFLKPLLQFFKWEQVLWLSAGLEILLTFLVLAVSYRAKRWEAGTAIVIALLFMKPILMLASFSMAVCWVITTLALLVILLRHERLEQEDKYPELFLLVGILTAYFDFLTYPVVTLGFPLCIYHLMKREEKAKKSIFSTILYSGCWALGYVAMWASKWVLADLTLHTGTIKSAVGSILGWTEAVGGRHRFAGGFYVIGLNLQEYDSLFYSVLFGCVIAIDAAAFVTACCRWSVRKAAACAVPYLLTACIPFVWFIVVQHHSGLHVVFTFRIMGVAVLALGMAGFDLFRRAGTGRRSEVAKAERAA